MTSTPVFAQTPKTWNAAILNATGAYTFAPNASTSSGRVTVITAGANGTVVEGISVSSTDSANKDLQLIILNSIDYVVSTIQIPLNAGFANNVPCVELFRHAQMPSLPLDPNGNKYLYLPSGYSLCVGVLTAVTSGKQISVTAIGADY